MAKTRQCNTTTQETQKIFKSIPHLWWQLGREGLLNKGTLLYVPSYIESAILKLAPYFDIPPIGPVDMGTFPIGLVSPRSVRKKKIAYSKGISTLKIGDELTPEELVDILKNAGYEKVSYVRGKGEYSRRGEVVDFYFGQPVRVLFDEDIVESLRIFSPDDQIPIASIPSVSLPIAIEEIPLTDDNLEFAGYKRRIWIAPRIWNYEVGSMPFKYDMQYVETIEPSVYDFKQSSTIKVITAFVDRTVNYLNGLGFSVKKAEKLSFSDDVEVVPGFFEDGYQSQDISLLTDYDLWPEIVGVRRRNVSGSIEVGSYVIHRLYGGIGVVEAIEEKPTPHIVIKYKGDVRIRTPITMLSMLYPYSNASGVIEITEVERRGWKRKIKKLEEIIQQAVERFIELERTRRHIEAPVMTGDPEIEEIVEKGFPYTLTKDQKKAIEDVYADLSSGKPMDRIICGDTGFGKTEVAIRAAARVVSSGYKVIVAAPTGVLAHQLYGDFSKRFEPAGINVGFYAKGKGKDNLRKFIEGKVDILVGTHSVFTDKITADKLGLVIVDDEHLFGVEKKEFYRLRYPHVHHLFMSATPIPRTLFHGMSGLKSISLIETPPKGRQPVDVVVARRSGDENVLEVIKDELAAGEKVIFVHNRIKDLAKYAGLIASAIPGARVEVLHGRMPDREIENVLSDVFEGKVDVLVATSIVGVGLNLLDFNVLVVNDIKYLGLASLYQIKGRVGRSGDGRGRVYFFYTETPRTKDPRFLETLAEFGTLGYGFVVSNLDMELRGIGDVFGIRQSGFFDTDTFGFELIKSLVADVIARITKGETSNVTIRWNYVPFDFLTGDDRVMAMNVLIKADWDLWEKFRLFVQSTYDIELEESWDDYFALVDILKNSYTGRIILEISKDKVSITSAQKKIEVGGSVPEVFGVIISNNL
ncbi:DEAD/DEAH box helicase [bacterium 3DAC]|nr:DEAD/DEAH box helicase [bacterium 3DAC]